MGLRWPVPSMRPRAPCRSFTFVQMSHTHTYVDVIGSWQKYDFVRSFLLLDLMFAYFDAKIPESKINTNHFSMLCKHVQMRCWHCSKIVSQFMFKSFQAHFFIIQSAILSVAIVRVFMTIMFDCHMQVLPHPTSILDGSTPQSSQHNLNLIPHKLRRISKWSPNNPQILPNSYQNHSQTKTPSNPAIGKCRALVIFEINLIKIVGELIWINYIPNSSKLGWCSIRTFTSPCFKPTHYLHYVDDIPIWSHQIMHNQVFLFLMVYLHL